MSKSPVTCHVLDASKGTPAKSIKVSLDCLALLNAPEEGVTADTLPQTLAYGETDSDGRCTTLLPSDQKLLPGIYKMIFHTGPYFEAQSVSTFYPLVEITFNYTNPEQHYHIPLLLSPFSYTTYRGS